MNERVTDWDLDIRTYWENGVWDDTTITDDETPDVASNDEDMTDSELNETPAGQLNGVILASELLDMDVRDALVLDDQDNVGSVRNLTIDSQSGEVNYLIVEIIGVDGLENHWTAIPLDAPITIDEEDEVLVISAGLIESAPAYDGAPFSNTVEPTWYRQVDNYWNDQQ